MASATSKVSKVQTGTSVRNKESNFYTTEVTTLADGNVERKTYRTDANGNNGVLLQTTTTDVDSGKNNTVTTSNVTQEEKRALNNPDSQLRQTIKQQTDSVKDEVLGNSTDPVSKENVEKAGGSDGNSAKTEEGGDSQASESGPQRQTGSFKFGQQGLQYPELLPKGQDCVQFVLLKYDAKDLTTDNQQGLGFATRARVGPGGKGERILGTVTLPIQSGIKDSNQVGWGEGKMNAFDIVKADIAKNTIEAGASGFAESLNRTGKKISEAVNSGEGKEAIAGIFASKAANVQGLLARTEGAVFNPNLELLFNGPSLRSFSFSFRLSARNKNEAEKIVKIIRFFKEGMAPFRSDANLFLLAPHTFQVHYLYRGPGANADEHPYIGKMKECALTGFETNYTPENNYTTLKDGFMSSYQITMTMKELEPVFADDYKDLTGNEIGF